MSKKKKQDELDLGDSLTIEKIAGLRQKFDAVVADSSELKISPSTIESIDLTGVQLLIYMQKICEGGKKKISGKLRFSEFQAELLKSNGFTNILETFSK